MKDKLVYAESRSTNQKIKSYFEKVRDHKTEIVIAGVTIVSIAGVILLEKNWGLITGKSVTVLMKDSSKVKVDSIPVFQTAIESIAVEVTTTEKIIDVNKHIRNLSLGHKASPEKLLSAIENGMELSANQTWVDAYSKMCA